MEFLYDSKGRHAATVVDGHIYGVGGACIGYCQAEHGVFIDVAGRYLGEIAFGDRLMYNLLSLHCTATFDPCPPAGPIDIAVSPGCREPLIRISRYVDIDPARLEAPPSPNLGRVQPMTGLPLLLWAGQYSNPEGFGLLLPYL